MDTYFPNVPTIMFTLVQFIFHDSTALIYRDLVLYDNYLMFYFMLFFLFVSVALMNLVTAVVIEGSMAQQEKDKAVEDAYTKEMQRMLLPKMIKIFQELDKDGSGELSFKEFSEAPQDVQDQMSVLMDASLIEDLFDIMDDDGTGTVSMTEFFDGLTQSVVSNVPIEHLRILKKLDRCLQKENVGNELLGQVIDELQKPHRRR